MSANGPNQQPRQDDLRRICDEMFDLADAIAQQSETDPTIAKSRQRLFELREAYRKLTGTFPILPGM